jgi:hypothetical protein
MYLKSTQTILLCRDIPDYDVMKYVRDVSNVSEKSTASIFTMLLVCTDRDKDRVTSYEGWNTKCHGFKQLIWVNVSFYRMSKYFYA